MIILVYFNLEVSVIMSTTSTVLLFITSVCGVAIISSLLVAGSLFFEAQGFLETSLDEIESFKVSLNKNKLENMLIF